MAQIWTKLRNLYGDYLENVSDEEESEEESEDASEEESDDNDDTNVGVVSQSQSKGVKRKMPDEADEQPLKQRMRLG